MAQLPYNPMKHRALQAGADRYFVANVNTLRESIAGTDLVVTGTAAPASDLGTVVNVDIPARTWVDQDLKLEPGAFLNPGAFELSGRFTLFGRFGVRAAAEAGSRTLLAFSFANGDTLELYLSSDTANEPSSLIWFWQSAGAGMGGGYANATLPVSANEEYVYAGLFTSDQEVMVFLATPGQKPQVKRLLVTTYNAGTQTTTYHRPGKPGMLLNIGGDGAITGVDTLSGVDFRRRYSDRALRVSSLFTVPRDSSLAEMLTWVSLLETGRSSGAEVIPPVDNSEGLLGSAITAEDTLLALDGDPLKFVAPGPFEESRVTISDAADPSVFEVCALIGNSDGQLEVRRGVDGTAARAWAAGAAIRGLLTAAHFRPLASTEEPAPARIAPVELPVLGTGVTSLSVARSELIGNDVYAASLDRSTVLGDSAYAASVSGSLVMGAGSYAENFNNSILLGRWAYAEASAEAVCLGYSAYLEASNKSVGLGASVSVDWSPGAVVLGAYSTANYSDDTVILGRGRRCYDLPGVLVAPGPCVLPEYTSFQSLAADLPAHAKRTVYESVVFSDPNKPLAIQAISFTLPAGVIVFLDEVGFLLNGTASGSFDGMSVAVSDENDEFITDSFPLTGAMVARGRWKTRQFNVDRGFTTVKLLVQSAPLSAVGTLQAYIKGMFIQIP